MCVCVCMCVCICVCVFMGVMHKNQILGTGSIWSCEACLPSFRYINESQRDT